MRSASSAAVTLPGSTMVRTMGMGGGGAVVSERALSELEDERLLRRNTALSSAFADGHQLAEHGLIGCLAMSPAGTTGPIAALALRITRHPWPPAISVSIVII